MAIGAIARAISRAATRAATRAAVDKKNKEDKKKKKKKKGKLTEADAKALGTRHPLAGPPKGSLAAAEGQIHQGRRQAARSRREKGTGMEPLKNPSAFQKKRNRGLALHQGKRAAHNLIQGTIAKNKAIAAAKKKKKK